MILRNHIKRNIIIILSILAILLGIFSPSLTTLASLEEANKNFDREVDEYLGDSEDITDVMEKMMSDLENDPNPSKNTMPHVMKRLFGLGVYINDVEYGVLGKNLGVSKEDLLINGRYVCNPDAPNNLINHNCNIPNFTTSLFQNMSSMVYSPFINASKTSAHATFGLGVPKNIPGGEVPVHPGNRQHTYTALELFGYDLKLTSYNGEWDRIVVSSEARMLSNFGIIDRITLTGTTLWNSVKSGIGAYIENFSFNPFRWTTLNKAFGAAMSSGLNTVIDTQDLNIVATNSWKRESINDSLYNVYVLTDKEVMDETARRYFELFNESLNDKSDKNETLKKVMRLKIIPSFTFIEYWETNESMTARETAETHNAIEDARAYVDHEYIPRYVTIPEPVYYTEKEQLVFWAEENSAIISEAAEEGFISSNPDDYEIYTELVEKWNSAWENSYAREFNALGITITEMLEEIDVEIFVNHPHLDPKQGISHYACANADGTLMRDSQGNIEYLYLKNNIGSQEFVNPKCGKVRAPIAESLYGSGWHIDRPKDTRHYSNYGDDETGLLPNMRTGSLGRTLASFIAKITNVIIGFSFSPILNELGIDTIVATLIESFRDTIFFPMAALVVLIGAVLLFLQVLRHGSALQFFIAIFVTLFIFIAGSMFLLHPEATIKVIDEWPDKIDNFIANIVLSDDDGTAYCSTGNTQDGIRSAQCNVWGAMVFNPWVHLQFGTSYENLYAKGYAPAGGNEMLNTNESLVGNAEVNMGGGKKINNWAMYQLDLTKSGTITTKDNSSKQGLYNVDKNMYRIVDLQAGPNNGAGTDSRFLQDWSGAGNPNILLSLLTVIQSIFMAIALCGLGFSKIEVSFMFAISMIFLPFMLLYSFLPQGRGKLKSYLSNLISLLITRTMIVLMFSILLKIYNLAYAQTDNLYQSAILIIAISLTMIAYKKEFMNLIIATEGGIYKGVGQLSSQVFENSPAFIRQRVYKIKQAGKGFVSGGIGGMMGYSAARKEMKNEQKNKKRKIKTLEKKAKKTNLTEEEKELQFKLTEDVKIMKQKLDNHKKETSRLKYATQGARLNSHIIGRTAERKLRKEGFSINKIYSDAREKVIKKGADSMTNKEEALELDTYKELLSHSESNRATSSSAKLTLEEGRLLNDPKIQKRIRKLADERRKVINENAKNTDFNALLVDKKELEKIAKKIDKKRGAKRRKGRIKDPFFERTVQKEAQIQKGLKKRTATLENIGEREKDKIKKEIEKDKEKTNKSKGG